MYNATENLVLNYLPKSQVIVHVSEWINIKRLALIQYCRSIPFSGCIGSESGEKVYATNN